MFHLRLGKLFLIIAGCILLSQMAYSQQSIEELKKELAGSGSKAQIYNRLAEALLSDSSDASMKYARLALDHAISENSKREEGIALFGIAEVFSYSFQLDSAVFYYNKALVILKQAKDNYYISYTLNNLGWIYHYYGNYQEAIDNYIASIVYLDPELHADDLAHVYINIGNSYHLLGSYYTAIKFFRKSVSLIKRLDDKSSLPIAYNGLGLAYKYLSNFDSAIFYYNAMLEIDKQRGTAYDQAVDYGNIGALYFEWKQFDESFHFHKLALNIYLKEGNKNDLSVAYNNMGEVYKALGKYDSSLYYLNEALRIDQETGMVKNMANRYNNLGEVYFQLNEFDKSLQHFKKALEINQRNGSRYSVALNIRNIARVKQKTGNSEQAEKLFMESLEMAREINSQSLILSILESMADFYAGKNEYAKAFKYHQMIDEIKDTLFKEKNQELLADLQTRHELNKKEEKISILNSENELHVKEVQQYRTSTVFFACALLVISILLFILVFQYRLRQKAYKKLVQKNLELIESQKSNFNLETDEIEIGVNGKNIRYTNGNHSELSQKIKTYLKEEKPYLHPDLSVKDLAAELETNSHYISEVINRDFGNNFTGLINAYRVQEACRLLAEKNNHHLTIESIAREAGFNSKSAFNNAFKSVTGLTPSYYKKSAGKQ